MFSPSIEEEFNWFLILRCGPFYMPLKQPLLIFSYFYHRYQLTPRGQCHLITPALSPKSSNKELPNKYQREVLWKMAERYRGRKREKKKDTREIKSIRVIWCISESAITIPLWFLYFLLILSSGGSSWLLSSSRALGHPHLCSFPLPELCTLQISICFSPPHSSQDFLDIIPTKPNFFCLKTPRH